MAGPTPEHFGVRARVRQSLRTVVDSWSNLLFPLRCCWCDADIEAEAGRVLLCAECRRAIYPEEWSFCRYCGSPRRSGATDPTCRTCGARPLKFDRVVPLGPYRDKLRELVLRLKTDRRQVLSRAAARLFVELRGEALGDLAVDLVVPVPMHWARRLTRGTNSPEVLAEEMSSQMGVPMEGRAVFRHRNTLDQTKLKPKERFRNVRGAFSLRAGYDWTDRSVLLVDDVLTTGATCSEVAGVLKKAGAESVVVAVWARTEGPPSG